MRRIVNAGSVGEPRHGGTKATYVVYNDVTNKVKIREVEYDIELTLKHNRCRSSSDFCMAFKKWIRICRTS